MNKKILVVHPTGNQNSRAVARGLANDDSLHTFITALNIKSENYKWLPNKIYNELKRRDFSEINGNIKSGASFLECLRLISNKLKINFLTKHEVGVASVDNIYITTDKNAAKYLDKNSKDIKAVYCYEDGALETFKIAKKHGIICIYELPTGYWRSLHSLNKEENENNKEWSFSWSAIKDSNQKLLKKDEELMLADVIFVASNFTKETLKDFPKKLSNIYVIPYGFPKAINFSSKNWFSKERKLKVLFVGGLKQGKGLSYMVDAINKLKDKVTFSYIGEGPALNLIKTKLPEGNYLGTMAHEEVLNQMKNHDVLLFPSLFEGFGMVITEAMSQGMVVIASDNTALPDIADNSSSICVPIRDSKSIEIALKKLIEEPFLVQSLGKEALLKASTYQWKNYEENISKIIKEFKVIK